MKATKKKRKIKSLQRKGGGKNEQKSNYLKKKEKKERNEVNKRNEKRNRRKKRRKND